MTDSSLLDRRLVPRAARAAGVLAVAIAYLGYVFGLLRHDFWTSGLGDWMDPYFINALLEHWYHAAPRLSDPASPPMYHPARHTLGYSHGLVLYALFYVPLRMLAHPFTAYNLTLVVVMATGIVCLYVLLRKLGVTFVEALLLIALFFSSKNVINGGTNVWSQRASVFLIPPIMLIILESWRRGTTRMALCLAWIGGLLAALMYTQDFYTAHFAFLFAVLLAVPFGFAHLDVLAAWGDRVREGWGRLGRGAKLALLVALLSGAWTCRVLLVGGVGTTVFGIRMSSTAWQRPLLIAVVSFLVFLRLRAGRFAGIRVRTQHAWAWAAGAGAVLGLAVFAWSYGPAYREHRAFPEEHLINALAALDPSRWTSPLDFVRDLGVYDTLRSFKLVFATAVLASIPWFGVPPKARGLALWFLLVSLGVLLAPVRFHGFSFWRTFIEWVPGFDVIRDPRRIIYLYELAVVVMLALFLTQLRRTAVLRVSVTVLGVFLLLTDWNDETFAFARAPAVHERWVDRPIAIDPACESFFIKRASEEYSARSDNMWMLYNIDSFFVALAHSVPTLNGYSAWWPLGWNLFNPEHPEYHDHVGKWIERHGLSGVCEFDIQMRTMTRWNR